MKIYVFTKCIYLLVSKKPDTKYLKFHTPFGSKLTHTIKKKEKKNSASFLK